MPQCPSCNGNHALRACDKFRGLTVSQRQEQVRKSRACYNCLGIGHSAATCPSQRRCRFCQAKHNTLLHAGSVESTTPQTTGNQTSVAGDSTSPTDQVANLMTSVQGTVLLTTARVKLLSDSGRQTSVCALLDSESQASFISERAAQQLLL